MSTENNKEFLIKRPKLILKPGDFLTVRFYVKFTPGRPIPQLTAIKINNKLVCPENTQEFPPVPQVTSFDVLLEDRNGNETSTSSATTTTTYRTP